MHAVDKYDNALRADLQEYYGIDLDKAMAGEHTPVHIAALAEQLPARARCKIMADDDNRWTLDSLLLARLVNSFELFVYSLQDKQQRGRKPEPVGPSWAKKLNTRELPARAIPIEQLLTELNKPRGDANG